jgi:hypothetical protein
MIPAMAAESKALSGTKIENTVSSNHQAERNGKPGADRG